MPIHSILSKCSTPTTMQPSPHRHQASTNQHHVLTRAALLIYDVYYCTCTLVYVYSWRFNRFYAAVLMCVVSLLFIIIWPAAGGDTVCTILTGYGSSCFCSSSMHNARVYSILLDAHGIKDITSTTVYLTSLPP